MNELLQDFLRDHDFKKFITRTVETVFDVKIRGKEKTERGKTEKTVMKILIAAFIVAAMYFGGCIGEFCMGGTELDGVREYKLGFFHCLKNAVTTKPGFVGFIVIGALLLGFVLYLLFRSRTRATEDDMKFSYSRKGTYGTSAQCTEDEYKNFLEVVNSPMDTKGIILGKTEQGKIVAVREKDQHNRNFAICGSQGTNKSIAFSRNMVIQCVKRGDCFFVTDPKSELYRDLAYYLEKEGYYVVQWNLISRWNSNSWDILSEINGEDEMEYIDILCNAIIMNTTDSDKLDFFDKAENVLLKALCLYVYSEYPEGRRTIGNVYDLLLTTDPDQLDSLFEALPASHPARGPYMLFQKSANNKGNAILGLGSRLNIFQNKVIKNITGFPEIDIEKMTQKKTAIFGIISDTNSTYNMLNALFISMVFIKIFAYADRQPNNKLERYLHFILDEFPNSVTRSALKTVGITDKCAA